MSFILNETIYKTEIWADVKASTHPFYLLASLIATATQAVILSLRVVVGAKAESPVDLFV